MAAARATYTQPAEVGSLRLGGGDEHGKPSVAAASDKKEGFAMTSPHAREGALA